MHAEVSGRSLVMLAANAGFQMLAHGLPPARRRSRLPGDPEPFVPSEGGQRILVQPAYC